MIDTRRRASASARAKGRATLTRDEVVAAAAGLLEAEGEAGVSMRRLAEVLNTGPSTLYWHVRDKQELLLAILEESSRVVRARADGPWQARLQAMLVDARAALRTRPALIPVLWASGWQLGPETLRVVDELLGLIAESGAPRDEVADIYFAVTTFLFGFITAETTSPGTGPFVARSAEARSYPNLARYVPAADAAGMDRRFARGVARLIAGIDANGATKGRVTSRPGHPVQEGQARARPTREKAVRAARGKPARPRRAPS